jgi:hypothetical protein
MTPLTEGVDAKIPIPLWLDAELLYNINYGPATVAEINTVRSALDGVATVEDRSRITLLDRRIADRLHGALFNKSLIGHQFETDWEEGQTALSADPELEVLTVPKLSPFDYSLELSDESEPLANCESFCTNCIWMELYSGTILGLNDRPPLAAVVSDLIAMVKFLSAEKAETPRTITECLTDFVRKTPFQSVTSLTNMDQKTQERMIKGYLSDMFNIVIAVGFDAARAEG